MQDYLEDLLDEHDLEWEFDDEIDDAEEL